MQENLRGGLMEDGQNMSCNGSHLEAKAAAEVGQLRDGQTILLGLLAEIGLALHKTRRSGHVQKKDL